MTNKRLREAISLFGQPDKPLVGCPEIRPERATAYAS